MVALLSGGLGQRLDHVVAAQLAQFDAELRKLDLDPKSGEDCSLALGGAPAVSQSPTPPISLNQGWPIRWVENKYVYYSCADAADADDADDDDDDDGAQGKGKGEEPAAAVACLEYRNGLEQQVGEQRQNKW